MKNIKLHQRVILFCCLSFSSFVFARVGLEEKLQKQWSNYQDARTLLLNRVQDSTLTNKQRLIDRAVWEDLLQTKNEFALTQHDLDRLRQRQLRRIRKARWAASHGSPINLNSIRQNDRAVKSFCEAVPKGGMLHVHPFGTFSRETVDRLLRSRDPLLHFQTLIQEIGAPNSRARLFPDEINWLTGLGADQQFSRLSPEVQNRFQDFLFLPPGRQPFPRFNAVFAFLGTVVPDLSALEEAYLAFAQRAVSEGVIYVEFTDDYFPAEKSILERIQAQTGLMIRVNRSFNRTKSIDELAAQLQNLMARPEDPLLVGIDFLDNEDGNSALDKGQLLYGTTLAMANAGQTKLHRTMHAGEIGDGRNPRDAMILGAERLGHGVRLHDDVVALEYAARHHVPVEINLSSNLRLTQVQQIRTHPFLNYLRLGLPVSLSTDDEGIFEIDIQHECEIAIQKTDVTYAELKQMAVNSIETSFATTADKAVLKTKLMDAFAQFELGHMMTSRSKK